MIERLGIQLYTVKVGMKTATDIRNTFRRLKAMGYDYGQTDGAAIPYEELGRIAAEEEFEICGTHDNFEMMIHDPMQAIANHRALNTHNMGIPAFPATDIQNVEEFIEIANTIANNIYDYGFKFTYHNHAHEFRPFENGKTAMEMLVEGLDPVKTAFTLDTYWIQYGGGDVRHWLERLAGRVEILHLKDMYCDGKVPVICEVGNGNMWWEGILETAVNTGVKYFVVEQDRCPGDPFDSARISSEYIHKHFMK